MPTTDDTEARMFRVTWTVTHEHSFSVTARGLWNLLDPDARRRLYGDDFARFEPATVDPDILHDDRLADLARATETRTPHRPTGARPRARRDRGRRRQTRLTPTAPARREQNTAHTRNGRGQQP